MEKTLRFVNKICAEICGWMLSVVMILMLIDVICRTVATPVMGVVEIAMFVMIGTVYAGLANCEMLDGHVRVGSLVELLSPARQRWAVAATQFLGLVTIALATWAMCDNAWASFVDGEGIAGAVNYPLYPVKFVMGLGMILYTLQIAVNLVKTLRSGKD